MGVLAWHGTTLGLTHARAAFPATLLPQCPCYRQGIDLARLPPTPLITRCVVFGRMNGAKRHCELAADFESEPSRLGKAHMMGIPTESVRHSNGSVGGPTTDLASGLIWWQIAHSAKAARETPAAHVQVYTLEELLKLG